MRAGWLRRPRTVAGLDVGSRYAKLVEVAHGGDEPEVVGIGVRDLADGVVVEGSVADPGRVAEALRALRGGGGAKRSDIVAAVGGHDVFLKRVEIESRTSADMADAVRREAERRVPFDIDGVRVDHHVLAPSADGSAAEVLLVAAKKDVVDARIALLAEARIAPAAIEVEALALHNALCHNRPDARDGVAALADVGHQVTNVNVMEDGVPVVCAHLPLGSKGLEAAVERECGVETAEARQRLHDAGPSPEVARLVTATARQIAAEIERCAAFLAARGSLATLGRVFLSGGAASIPGLADGVANRLRAETCVVNPFARVAIRPGVAGGAWLSQTPAMLLLALGLALRSV